MRASRWMTFVDGENLTIRAQQCQKDLLREDPAYRRDVFVWLPNHRGTQAVFGWNHTEDILGFAIRAYYYTSLVGSDDTVLDVREALRGLGFEPRVFKKESRTRTTKGVDIALATDFLSNAFSGNYDAAVLFAGDGDYVPMVEEVKRLGKRVYVSFFSDGLSPRLKLAADLFVPLEDFFATAWRR